MTDASEQVLAQAAAAARVELRASSEVPSDQMFFLEVAHCRAFEDSDDWFQLDDLRFSLRNLRPEITDERVLYVLVHPSLELAGRHMVRVLREHRDGMCAVRAMREHLGLDARADD